jgi:hypothetical protein
MKIEIETMIDDHDCETCGCSWVEDGVAKVQCMEAFYE